MQWDRSTSAAEPSSGRRRGRATAMVVAELGLDEAALADALAWARGRVEELLAALDDAELCALLAPAAAPERRAERVEPVASTTAAESLARDVDDAAASPDEPEDPSLSIDLSELSRLLLAREPSPQPEPTLPPLSNSAAVPARVAGAERRTTHRYSLVEPAVVSVESWHELVALYTKDIGAGGVFVQTDAPPEHGVQVAVRLLLPDGAGMLDFEGVVVHVVAPELAAASGSTPGFGVQFTRLTPERRLALQRLVEQAEAAATQPNAPGPTLQELAAAYRRLIEAADATGLLPPPPPFGSTAPFGSTPPSRPNPSQAPLPNPRRRTDAPRPANDRPAAPPPAAFRPAAPTPAEPPAPARRPRSTPPPVHPTLSPVEADVIVAQQRARMARRLASNLAEHNDRVTATLKRRDPRSAPPRPSRDEHRTLVEEALRFVADKRYAEAIARLELAVQRKPELRTRVLLCVVQARQAITERDFARARARYEAVLQLDPNHALAQRELLMLSALVR